MMYFRDPCLSFQNLTHFMVEVPASGNASLGPIGKNCSLLLLFGLETFVFQWVTKRDLWNVWDGTDHPLGQRWPGVVPLPGEVKKQQD